MDWKEEYEKKVVSAEEAVSHINSGDRVAFAYGLEPNDIALALVARTGELENVQLYVPAPGRDLPWYEVGWEEMFNISIGYVLPVARRMMEERRCDYMVSGLRWAEDPSIREPVDVLLIYLSTPDEHGYCSFGASLWDKKKAVRQAGIGIEDYVISGVATSQSVLSRHEKDLGVILIDMGSDLTEILVFLEGKLAHIASLPVAVNLQCHSARQKKAVL